MRYGHGYRRILIRIGYFFLLSYWFLFRPRVREVVCVAECEGKILLVQHTYGQPLWTFPGGGVRNGETDAQALAREMREELAMHISHMEQIGTYEQTREYKREHISVFRARASSPRIRCDRFEILRAQWVRPDRLSDISPDAQRILSFWNAHCGMIEK